MCKIFVWAHMYWPTKKTKKKLRLGPHTFWAGTIVQRYFPSQKSRKIRVRVQKSENIRKVEQATAEHYATLCINQNHGFLLSKQKPQNAWTSSQHSYRHLRACTLCMETRGMILGLKIIISNHLIQYITASYRKPFRTWWALFHGQA